MEPHRSILEFSALTTVLRAHDLQHLLSIMSACAVSLAARAHPLLAERDFAELNEAIDSAFRLSRELLAAVGLQQAAEPPVIDVHELIVRYQGTMLRLVGGDIRLVINTEPRPAPIAATPVHVEWILLNLLANARDATPHGGTIHLATAHIGRWRGPLDALVRDERYFEMMISDEGDSADVEAESFEPFLTTKRAGGTLGLASVAATVRALKGWLYVERHGQTGRTVHVLLPLYARKPGDVSPGAPN
jgi:signal transduction histidine kinase